MLTHILIITIAVTVFAHTSNGFHNLLLTFLTRNFIMLTSEFWNAGPSSSVWKLKQECLKITTRWCHYMVGNSLVALIYLAAENERSRWYFDYPMIHINVCPSSILKIYRNISNITLHSPCDKGLNRRSSKELLVAKSKTVWMRRLI